MTDAIRNHTTPEGAALGKHTARLCDTAEPAARLKLPELPPRCNSCAAREGPHVANGSPVTQMDFLKCIMEGHEFYCHEPARANQICSGWAIFMLAKQDAGFITAPWDFSADPETEKDRAA
jgi:hypothetical protein